MRNKKSLISIAMGSAFASSLGITPACAADDLFALQTLDKGYMLAYADRVDPNKYGGAKPGSGGAKSAEGRCGMSMVDANKDGKVTKEEFLKHHEAIFDSIDANKDGAVDQPEADGYSGKSNAASPNTAPHGAMKK
ncbi:hypothetical protein [Nitrosovibrio tenuis]|uniref:EF hand n=1 Tax=Nitrosovibrio tenuis TaxID=1233 RepID=A0A1H7LU33_9PROT|nr:hypothetical protein [Nitrosovibrio tenuis]SEL02369.1 EF hand [Nitrosovibrio tenuis]